MVETRRIAITGASSGLGAALARALAGPGVQLHLCARGLSRLEDSAAACRALGATVQPEAVDLRDPAAGPAWLARIEAQGPLDLLILNAGIFAGRPDPEHMEPVAIVPDVIATNLTAPVQCATHMAQAMRARGQGRIVLISSLAAVSPSPDSPSYSASKAGLSAFAKALGDDLAGSGVGVTLVEPGHIRSYHTEQQIGAVPLAMSADDAAARILAGMARNAGRIAFPLVPRVWVRLTDALPRRLRLMLNRSQRFSVRNTPPR